MRFTLIVIILLLTSSACDREPTEAEPNTTAATATERAAVPASPAAPVSAAAPVANAAFTDAAIGGRSDTETVDVAASTDVRGAQSSQNRQRVAPSTLTLQLRDNRIVRVPDFTRRQPAWANASSGYQVAGSEDAAFHILFYPDGSYFNVSLLELPLRTSRSEAEAALRSVLRLSSVDLCQLSIQVGVPASVSASYAGRDLGLSFCRGAMRLP